MVTVKKITSPIADVCILLGKQGENEAREIVFDLSWLIETYGDGTAVLVHQRAKDAAPYICQTTQDGSELTWVVTNTDTAYDGWGQAELRWTVGSTLAKTLIYKTMVARSITAGEVIPDPYESWYEQMMAQIGDNAEYAQQAQQAAETATTAASTAAADAVSAVRSEMTGYVQQASQSAQNASQSATQAESAKQSILSASITVTPAVNNGNLTFSAAIEGGE